MEFIRLNLPKERGTRVESGMAHTGGIETLQLVHDVKDHNFVTKIDNIIIV